MGHPITISIRVSRLAVAAVLAVGLVGGFAWQASATSLSKRPPANPTAVAVVNLPKILEELEERTTREETLAASGKGRQQQLDTLTGRIQVVEADLKILKEGTAEYRDKLIELRELQVTLDARFKLLNQVMSFERGAVMGDLYSKINDAIKRVSERDGYDIVLLSDEEFKMPPEASQEDMNRAVLSRSVLYTHPSVDISDQVIRMMNNEYQAGRRP